jgi:spore maturation protein CgeB
VTETSLKILYLGDGTSDSTSFHRLEALRRLGHEVELAPLGAFAPRRGRFGKKIHYRTGHRFEQRAILAGIEAIVGNGSWDLTWVDSGWWCGPAVARLLRSKTRWLCLVNVDDPTGPREPWHWRSLLSAVCEFDLCVTVRRETAAELKQLGAQRVLAVSRGYDESGHDPRRADAIPPDQFRSRAAFIGTRMEDRDEFMAKLIERGVPLSIWGNGWQGSRAWKIVAPYWRGKALIGSDYVAAIRRADVCLGLLSKLNRDLHTQRSAEIPYAHGLLCAQRTSEHLAMYEEGVEAAFWDDVEECADVCLDLLANPHKREAIRSAGAQRVRALGIGNEVVCRQIVAAASGHAVEPQFWASAAGVTGPAC